jgi:SIR2-like domain
VSFAIFRRADVNELVEHLSESSRVTVIVGAGGSIEAGLPDWQTLVRNLLRRAASGLFASEEVQLRDEWINETLEKDGLLGAAAVVEALSGEQLQVWLLDELFQGFGAADFAPGAISRQVALLRRRLGDRLTIVTSNYDDLLEQALAESGYAAKNIKAYIRHRTVVPTDAVPVTHLHGFAGRQGTKGTLILSEEHYHQMQRRSSWQELLMSDRLLESNCLFVGSSLTDPNLIRYLYGYRGERSHYALFVRQAELRDLDSQVRAAREEATAARWKRCGVEAVFVDHFADVAQILHEVGLRHQDPKSYTSLFDRASTWINDIESTVIGIDRDTDFEVGQVYLSDRLRALLRRGVTEAERFGADFSNEALAASLWLATSVGDQLMSWATTDRLHRDRSTMEPVPIIAGSRWIAVEAFCRGARFEEDRDIYASRWRYIRGLPLTPDVPGSGLLPIGCLTVTSTLPGSKTMLEAMDDDVKANFHEILVNGMLSFLAEAASPASL